MTDLVRSERLIADLRDACRAAGGQAEWARRNRLSIQYVCNVLNGHFLPGPKIAAALGYRQVKAFERLGAIAIGDDQT